MTIDTKTCGRCNRTLPLAEFWTAKNGHMKSYCVDCMASYNRQAHIRIRERRRASRYEVDREVDIRLPIGPFRDWLDGQISRLALHHHNPEMVMAQLLGVPQRRLYGWLHTNKWISLDKADAAFCRWGEPDLLRYCWPHIYEFDEESVA